ncbi:MAG: hypothetical protein MRQ13_04740 [Candidatus Midichloria sp.]|nr:hypothetical protein [Candidatus Midichloria sp.]
MKGVEVVTRVVNVVASVVLLVVGWVVTVVVGNGAIFSNTEISSHICCHYIRSSISVKSPTAIP